jgi:hypothetical protein
MSIEGEIAVALARAAGRVTRVSIRSSRPLATARVLVGRRIGEAAALVPRLYSVCANAQGAAAASALAAAAGHPRSAAWLAARAHAVALENLQEDLRRLLIDVPAALGHEPRVAPVVALRRACAAVLYRPAVPVGQDGAPDAASAPAIDTTIDAAVDAAVEAAIDAAIDIVSRDVLGEPLAEFAARVDADALERWARAAATAPARALCAVLERGDAFGASDVPSLPALTRAQVDALLAALSADATFAARPRLDGAPRETGALARMANHPAIAAWTTRHGRGVATRLAARVVDVARTSRALADGTANDGVDAWPGPPGTGVARVETARGLLVHRAEVRDDVVTGYGILAPTEWNFQPGGSLERSLAGLGAHDEAALCRDAALVVQSLDPCVACRVEVHDA